MNKIRKLLIEPTWVLPVIGALLGLFTAHALHDPMADPLFARGYHLGQDAVAQVIEVDRDHRMSGPETVRKALSLNYSLFRDLRVADHPKTLEGFDAGVKSILDEHPGQGIELTSKALLAAIGIGGAAGGVLRLLFWLGRAAKAKAPQRSSTGARPSANWVAPDSDAPDYEDTVRELAARLREARPGSSECQDLEAEIEELHQDALRYSSAHLRELYLAPLRPLLEQLRELHAQTVSPPITEEGTAPNLDSLDDLQNWMADLEGTRQAFRLDVVALNEALDRAAIEAPAYGAPKLTHPAL